MHDHTSQYADYVISVPGRSLASERVYAQLKKMILSGKLKKGQRLLQDGIAQDFSVSKMAVTIAFSQLKKERLIISTRGAGSSVA